MVCLGYMENNKYEKGKIYLVTDVAYTKCYYGSTCEELSKRFWRHKGVYKTFLDGKCSYKHSICQLFDEFGVENCKIELVELFPTNPRLNYYKEKAITSKTMLVSIKKWQEEHRKILQRQQRKVRQVEQRMAYQK